MLEEELEAFIDIAQKSMTEHHAMLVYELDEHDEETHGYKKVMERNVIISNGRTVYTVKCGPYKVYSFVTSGGK